MITLEQAKKIIRDSVSNTYVDINVIGILSDDLKRITLSYMFANDNINNVYGIISKVDQEMILDFLVEVYYHIKAYGYEDNVFLSLKNCFNNYLANSQLPNAVKDLRGDTSNNIDYLYGVLVFLRLFLKQLDNALIVRRNEEQE